MVWPIMIRVASACLSKSNNLRWDWVLRQPILHIGAPIAAYAVDQVFADIWTRPGLDRRSRSLVSMSVTIAMRQPHEFAIHMGAGLNNGLTLKEIEEVLIQALPYVGYPAIAIALAAAAEVIKEHGLDVDENYTGHRGLL